MLRIEYKIITPYFGEIEDITDEEIHYDFLLGSISLFSPDAVIEMEWEWIPLLDFAYCLKNIAKNILPNYKAVENFEFTENAETLEFSKEAEQLRISASFSPIVISASVIDFDMAITEFHSSISEYIRKNILSKELPENLQKYLSIEV